MSRSSRQSVPACAPGCRWRWWSHSGWLAIGVAGFVAVPARPPGAVTIWMLAAYAVLRFGLEGVRGDARPTWLGVSQGRCMAAIQAAAAVMLAEVANGRTPFAVRPVAVAGGLLLSCGIGGVYRHVRDPRS